MLKIFTLFILLGLGAYAVAEETSRLITVTGQGIVEYPPDEATINMSIVVRRTDLADAQAEAARIVGKALDMIARIDIDRDHVDTTGTSVHPDYRWNRDRETQEFHGYVVERRIVVDLDDLDKLGAVVEGAIEAGVNQVMPPQLNSSKRDDAHRQALRAAAEDARRNAAALADALGVQLGGVVSISAGHIVPQPRMSGGNLMSLSVGSDAAETYSAADLSFSASVSAVFELTN